MKKIIYFFLCSLFLGGCLLPEQTNKDTILEKVQWIYESELPAEAAEDFEDSDLQEEAYDVNSNQASDNTTVGQGTEKEAYLTSDGGLTQEAKAKFMRSQQGLYAYSALNVMEQNLYVEILYALENYVDEMRLSTTDTEEIDKVFQYVWLDHPEIFYADGYSFVTYTLGDEIQKITFKGNYIYTPEERKEREALLEEAVLEMIKGIPAKASDYEKVKYAYETISRQTEYSMEAADNQNICSVFLGKASVCQGYAKAMQYLLRMLDVDCCVVIGTVETGEAHAWNLVKIDNQYYYVDATWGDASYLLQTKEAGVYDENIPAINYDYLCVTTDDISKTHSFSDLLPLPFCDSLEANYYVREGAYFTGPDMEQLQSLIARCQQEGRETVTLKCSDDKVYSQMAAELLEGQAVFRYLQTEGNSIMYTDSPKQRTLTFWL